MGPSPTPLPTLSDGFPFVSGDEPVTQQGGADKPMFSPRERG